MNYDVVVTDATFPDVDKEEAAARAAGATFKRFDCKVPDEVTAAVKGAKVAVVQFAQLNVDGVAALAPGARVIRYGVGYNNLDINAMQAADIGGAYVPDYCTSEVADHTAAMILTRLRKIPDLDASVKAGDWAAVAVAKPMKAFSETTIGFFGFGRIAQAVARRLASFGFSFVVTDPVYDPNASDLDVTVADFDTLLAQSDCLSLHAPATPDTVGKLNADAFRAMKPTAYLVNSARGDLIDEDDLAAALNSGDLAGAALDVFLQEPLATSSPLRTASNLTLSPHAAWYSDVAVESLQSLVADEIMRALTDQPMRCPIPGTEQD